MRKGNEYARKLKQAFARLRRSSEAPLVPEPTDPLEQLIVAALSQETTSARGRKAFRRLSEQMVDLNELRVSTPAEVAELISPHVPRNIQRSKVLLKLLNAIFLKEYAVSLESIKTRGMREAREYLEALDGATPYVVASVLLWSLGAHAVPVNDAALNWLVRSGLVDAAATGAEVQAFLERHIAAGEAKAFCLELETQAAQRAPAADVAPPAGGPSPAEAAAATRTPPARKAKGPKPAARSAGGGQRPAADKCKPGLRRAKGA